MHAFLLQPGTWLGQGTIEISESPEELKYFTRWKISKMVDSVIFCVQEVEVNGASDKTINYYTISEMTPHDFKIELDNTLFGKMIGRGLIDKEIIAWGFQEPGQSCRGFEIFEKTQDGKYTSRAEFIGEDHIRTLIKGVVWQTEDK